MAITRLAVSAIAESLGIMVGLGVKSMQRSGTEAIRTKIQPSNPKRKITNITNNQNSNRTY